MTSDSKKKLILVSKIFITLGLCTYLLFNANWNEVPGLLGKVGLPVTTIVFIIMLLSITISTYKWDIILQVHRIYFKFSALHKYYFIATFFNNFLPTSIGGDGYRIYKTLDNQTSRACAVLAVFMERVSGLVALILVGSASSLYILFAHGSGVASDYVLLAGLLCITGCAVMFILLQKGVIEKIKLKGRLFNLIKNNIGRLGDYNTNRNLTYRVIAISFLFHIHNSLSFFILLNFGVGADISLPQLYVALTLVNLIAVLPISINGIGVVDGAFIYLTGLYGASYDESLTVMIVTRLLLIPLSMIGGVLYFMNKSPVTPVK
ncbi:MAG: flippase-like domain-containing protein [Gammaproteobacteria bacterium]|nr:MAG: flippase-like domain-containing protein [Gammaproteobacteria bacterium]